MENTLKGVYSSSQREGVWIGNDHIGTIFNGVRNGDVVKLTLKVLKNGV
jgi:hypothetical protein